MIQNLLNSLAISKEIQFMVETQLQNHLKITKQNPNYLGYLRNLNWSQRLPKHRTTITIIKMTLTTKTSHHSISNLPSIPTVRKDYSKTQVHKYWFRLMLLEVNRQYLKSLKKLRTFVTKAV